MRDRSGQCLNQNLNPNVLDPVSMILTTELKERNFKNPSLKNVFLEVPTLGHSEIMNKRFYVSLNFQSILSYFETPLPFIMTLVLHY